MLNRLIEYPELQKDYFLVLKANIREQLGNANTAVLDALEATESWRSRIRAADAPIGMLMSQFDNIRESWIEKGSQSIEPPIRQRRELFSAWKAEHAGDESIMPEEGEFDSDSDWRNYWNAEYKTHTASWSAIEIATTAEEDEQDMRDEIGAEMVL